MQAAAARLRGGGGRAVSRPRAGAGPTPAPPRSPADSQYLSPLVCVGFAALTPACVLIAKQNPPVVRILKFGWFPIVLAMLVSRCAFLCPSPRAGPQDRGSVGAVPLHGRRWAPQGGGVRAPGAPLL